MVLQFDADFIVRDIIDQNIDDKDFYYDHVEVYDIKSDQVIYQKNSDYLDPKDNILVTNRPIFIQLSNDTSKPDVFNSTFEPNKYITRVFSPFNLTTTNRSYFDYMISIAG